LRTGLFATRLLRFAQPYARTSTVLVNKLDASIFERALDYLESRASWRARSGFQLVNRHYTDTGCTSKILLAPR
jgi:hypothetical protein